MRTLLHSLIRKLRCRLGRHAWTLHEITSGGVLLVVPRCDHCMRVDVDGIRSTTWNRAERRRWRRALRS